MAGNKKDYLGDGAYVEFDGASFILTAENGIEATDTVHLEYEAVLALIRFVERVTGKHPDGR